MAVPLVVWLLLLTEFAEFLVAWDLLVLVEVALLVVFKSSEVLVRVLLGAVLCDLGWLVPALTLEETPLD